MGADTGSYTKFTFDEEKRYVKSRVQKNIPWVDADDNEASDAFYTALRRIRSHIGDGRENAGFTVEEATAIINDIVISGGGGTADNAGRITVEGHHGILFSDVNFINSGATEGENSIHQRTTDVQTLVLEDTAANYVVDELVGRPLIPNIADGTAFTVTSNTATTITVGSGDMTSVAATGGGDFYRVGLTTPSGSNRTDGVYINMYLDEIDKDEDLDGDLSHEVFDEDGGSTVVVEAQRRSQLIQSIMVREDTVTHGDLSNYVDSDGHQHHVLKLGVLNRLDGVDQIATGDIVNDAAISNCTDLCAELDAVILEVTNARGSTGSLDARLDVSLEEDGTLKVELTSFEALSDISPAQSLAMSNLSGSAPSAARHFVLGDDDIQLALDNPSGATASALRHILLGIDGIQDALDNTNGTAASAVRHFILGTDGIQDAIDSTNGAAASTVRHMLLGIDGMQDALDNTSGSAPSSTRHVVLSDDAMQLALDNPNGAAASATRHVLLGIDNVQDALDNATGPTSGNPFATIADVGGGEPIVAYTQAGRTQTRTGGSGPFGNTHTLVLAAGSHIVFGTFKVNSTAVGGTSEVIYDISGGGGLVVIHQVDKDDSNSGVFMVTASNGDTLTAHNGFNGVAGTMFATFTVEATIKL